jgi:phosphoribosylaminoimidazole carboxylase PurE protein
MSTGPLVGIVMGSDSDLPTMSGAGEVLERFGVSYELDILSAHRTPERAREYALSARERGLKVLIAGAGGAAHLAGFLAAHTTLPVIGVPLSNSALNGLDALLSTVQMPTGVPVATTAIDGAKNAGLLAVAILALSDESLAERLEDFRKEQTAQVLAKSAKHRRSG